jgi:RimJ/RimL family protein N-acetyltransferase
MSKISSRAGGCAMNYVSAGPDRGRTTPSLRSLNGIVWWPVCELREFARFRISFRSANVFYTAPQTLEPAMIPKKTVRIDSEKYFVRTIGADDATDRWAGWLSDPEAMHMLNMPVRAWKKTDLVNYIKTFDQETSLLLGIFEKQTGTHIGVFTVDINYALGQFLVNLLIGEPEYRNKGVTSSITMPFRDYFFDTLGLGMAMASVLKRNSAMIHYLLKSGWKLEQTLERGAKSNHDRTMLDLCLFSLSREAWRDWKKKQLASRKKG